MQGILRFLLAIGAVLSAVQSSSVTPVEKVIELLERLHKKVTEAGQAEAQTYDTFACFCRDTTATKSNAITSGKDTIEQLSANIEDNSANAKSLQLENAKTVKNIDETKATIDGLEKELEGLRAEYAASNADLSAAILAIEKAIESLEAGKPTTLLQYALLVKAVALLQERQRSSALSQLHRLQSVPETDYEYHSNDIIATLQSLLKTFQDRKSEEDEDFSKEEGALSAAVSGQRAELTSSNNKLASDTESLRNHEQSVKEDRSSLLIAEAALKDDQLYLKDLTKRCETRASEWDQRSVMRGNEVKALEQALAVLRESAPLERERAPAALVQNGHASSVSFLQVRRTGLKENSFVQQSAETSQSHVSERVIARLAVSGRRIGSTLLETLAARLQGSGDPFVKVKNVIQKLLERLLEEANQENTQKGFCDTQTGKFSTERQFRKEEVLKLAVHLDKTLNDMRLTQEAAYKLTADLDNRKEELVTAKDLRVQEHDENMKSIQESREGISAIKEAKEILHVFYRDARNQAPIGVFTQVQVSPVEEDTSGPGFDGQYRGEQEQSEAIMGLLDIILSDFQRSLATTQRSEKEANQNFEYFREESEAFIAKTETDLDQRKVDLRKLQDVHKAGIDDIQTAQNLLDDALKGLEDIKSLCVDTAMTKDERFSKRDAEIQALKQAHTALGGSEY